MLADKYTSKIESDHVLRLQKDINVNGYVQVPGVNWVTVCADWRMPLHRDRDRYRDRDRDRDRDRYRDGSRVPDVGIHVLM